MYRCGWNTTTIRFPSFLSASSVARISVGMVAVVVVDLHAGRLADELEPPSHAPELGQPLADHVDRQVHLQGHRDHREGVDHVVVPELP